jgi:hypothetical protein
LHSLIIVSEEKHHERPIEVVCLEGLAVKRLFESQNGFGM